MSAAIIDYGMGNVASVQKALNFLKIPSVLTKDFDEIGRAKFIILPGVGSFQQGISNLKNDRLYDFLTTEVMERKKSFLGICLGMQLIATKGTEPYNCPGLGWIDGEVIKIEASGKRVPHLGWNTIHTTQPKYFGGLLDPDYYFIHSYHFKVTDPNCIAATVNYGSDLVACVQKDNIFATQFHPEKSQDSGLKLLKNFFELNA